MKLVSVINITSDFLTSNGGLVVGKFVENILQNDPSEFVEISFIAVPNITPSFVNGAFLYLIDNYGIDFFRSRVKVIQAAPEVAQTISNSVRTYILHQENFYRNLKLGDVYIIADEGYESKTIAHRLFAVANENSLPVNIKPIEQSDLFIGIISDMNSSEKVAEDYDKAIRADIPCIIILNKTIKSRIPTAAHKSTQVIYFSPHNYMDALKRLNEIIQKNRRKAELSPILNPRQYSDNSALILGALLLAAAFVAIVYSFTKTNNDSRET